MPNYNINNNDKETKKRPHKINQHYEQQLVTILNADIKWLRNNTFCCWSKCHPRVDEQTPLRSVNLTYHSTAAIIIRCHLLLLYNGLKKPGCHKSLTWQTQTTMKPNLLSRANYIQHNTWTKVFPEQQNPHSVSFSLGLSQTPVYTAAVHAPAFTGTPCAYTQRDGHAEFSWVASYIPACKHVVTHPSLAHQT